METRNNVGLILTIEELINTPSDKIVSELEKFIASIGYKKRRGEEGGFNQYDAWNIEVPFLQEHFLESRLDRNAYILFEYMLPGENSERPDALVLFQDCVYSLEFKTIGKRIKGEYVAQFIDYRTILQEYHEVCIEKRLKVKSKLVLCNCDALSVDWDKSVVEKIDRDDYNAVITNDKFQTLIGEMATHNAMGFC